MRSPFATQQEVTIPAGARSGTPRIYIGKRMPAELVTHYQPDKIVGGVLSFDAQDRYHYDISVISAVSGVIYEVRGWVDPGFSIFESGISESFNPDSDLTVVDLPGAEFGGSLAEVVLGETRINQSLTIPSGKPFSIDGVLAPRGTPTTYTPTLTATTTGPTLGTGSTQTGWYLVDPVTGIVDVWARIIFGTAGTAAGSGVYLVSLPTAISTQLANATGLNFPIGNGFLRQSTGTRNTVIVEINSFSGGAGGVGNVVMLLPTAGLVANNSPWVWSTSDGLTLFVRYLMA